MITRRQLLTCSCALAAMPLRAFATNQMLLNRIPLHTHESAMQEAIKMARLNPVYPFGAVITNIETGIVVAHGVNSGRINPTYHGEIVCINNYIEKFGNQHWENHILYTTGEPCPMCMSALVWAGIGGVVFGSSIETISRSGIGQINVSAQSVISASDFKQPELLGGVLASQCDQLFAQRLSSTPARD